MIIQIVHLFTNSANVCDDFVNQFIAASNSVKTLPKSFFLLFSSPVCILVTGFLPRFRGGVVFYANEFQQTHTLSHNHWEIPTSFPARGPHQKHITLLCCTPQVMIPFFPPCSLSGYVSFYFFVNILFTSSAFFTLCFRIAIVSCVLCFTSLTFLRGLIFHSSLAVDRLPHEE